MFAVFISGDTCIGYKEVETETEHESYELDYKLYDALPIEFEQLDNTKIMKFNRENGSFYFEDVVIEKTEPSELDVIGAQLVEKDLQIMELQSQNSLLGQQLVDMDLRLLQGGM